jgi:hypothetical protein
MAQFQNVTPNQLGQAALGTTVSTLYTVPASTRTFLKDFDVANTTAAPITLNVYLVPNAGTAGTSNALMYNVLVPGGSVLQWSGSQVLLPGATIQGSAGGTGLTITLSGGEAT